MKFADLHLHTLFSDGTSTPKEVIREAQNKGLSAIAIVDHDTVDALPQALEIAGSGIIEVLPGIELTAEYDGLEIHILGYLIDYKNKTLKEKLEFLKKNRIERAYKMVERLKNMGLALDVQDVFNLAKSGTVGRLHIAQALVKAGLAGSAWEAFQKYIGDKSPAYIAGFRLAPSEAINLIKSIGGIPVLAHPYSLNRDDLIPVFVDSGLMGIEVYYPEHTQSMINYYLALAKKFNLLVTGGSDFHGAAKPHGQVGLSKIPYELVEELKQAKP